MARRLLVRVRRLLLAPVVYAAARLYVVMTRRRLILGVEIGVVDHDAVGDWGGVARALVLIESIDPRRLSRIRRDFRYIIVAPVRSHRFWLMTRTCVLDSVLVRERSEALVAAALVHESVHARVNRICTPPEWNRRIETLCTREEIAFAERLPRDQFPTTDRFIAYLRSRL
jgi:hypothetical protein